jgi:hypothetical protein
MGQQVRRVYLQLSTRSRAKDHIISNYTIMNAFDEFIYIYLLNCQHPIY